MLSDILANPNKYKKQYDEQLIQKGKEERNIEIAISLLDVLDIKTIAKKTNLTIKEVEELKEKYASSQQE